MSLMQASVNPYQLKFNLEDFIRKGVVDLKCYSASETKIMLVVKGIIPAASLDETGFWREDDHHTTDRASQRRSLERLALICWAIQHGFGSWTKVVSAINLPEVKNSLKSIAFVAVPKFRDATVYRKVAIKDRYETLAKVLKEHVEVYQPDVVMFCGTYDLFNSKLFTVDDEDTIMAGDERNNLGHNRIYVNAPDPEVRSSDFRYYEGIRKTVEDLNLVTRDFAECEKV